MVLFSTRKKGKNLLYTLETVIKPGQNTDDIREVIIKVTGMAPGFYLSGTKIVVTHKLSLELLKRINDLDYVISVKATPYSAAASSDCYNRFIQSHLYAWTIKKTRAYITHFTYNKTIMCI